MRSVGFAFAVFAFSAASQALDPKQMDAFRIHSQYAAIASYCTSHGSPCLNEWDRCVLALAGIKDQPAPAFRFQSPDNNDDSDNREPFDAVMSPPLTLGSRLLYKFSTYETHPWIGSEGYIAINDERKEIIVAFGGSTVFTDWINDFRFWQTDYVFLTDARKVVSHSNDDGAYRVHAGMYDMYRQLVPLVVNRLADILKANATLASSYRLVSTGHSLGAVMSSLFALDLRAHQLNTELSRLDALRHALPSNMPLSVFALAQPRFANAHLMSYFDRVVSTGIEYIRVMNNHVSPL